MNDDSREATKAVLVFILVMIVCLFVGRLFADDVVTKSQNRYLIDDIQVTDGDTIKADIHLGFGVVLNDEELRPSDYDAWESSYRRRSKDVTITPAEIEKGKIAKQYLAELLNRQAVYIEPYAKENRDVYGRILCQWYILKRDELISVAEVMKRAGHQRSNE